MKELNLSKINDNGSWKQFIRMNINTKTELFKVYNKLIKWLDEFGKSIKTEEEGVRSEFVKETDKIIEQLSKIDERYVDLRKKMSSYDIGLWSLEELRQVFEYACSELKLFTTSPEIKSMLESFLTYGKMAQQNLVFTPSKMGDLHNFTDNSRKFVSAVNDCIAIKKEKRSADFSLKHGKFAGNSNAMISQIDELKADLKGSHSDFLKGIAKGLVVTIDTFKRMDNKETPNAKVNGNMIKKLDAIRLGLFIVTFMRTKLRELMRNQKTLAKCISENV